MAKTCFSIMPFEHGFDDIDKIIKATAIACGLEYVRGDRKNQPGCVLPQVIRDIRDAAVVVADISNNNPNVFYELGIAHHMNGPDRVILLTRNTDESPYDVHEFRQLLYQHNKTGRQRLRKALEPFLKAAANTEIDHEMWNVVRGKEQRTRLLVRDLQRLLDTDDSVSLKNVTIRIVASLGSLAISDHEPADPDAGPEYHRALFTERDALRKVLLRGARMKAILNPPRRFAESMQPDRLRFRYARLIGLLEGRSDIEDDPHAAGEDAAVIKKCSFVLSSVAMPNQFIIGDEVAYEGLKRGGAGGFEMTHCETRTEPVKDLIRQFDTLFTSSQREMTRRYPPDGRLIEQLKRFEAEAASEE